MAPDSYFQDYVQILNQALKKVRKIGFKRYNILKDFIDTTQNFLTKQVYGRIQPSNYLLCLILLLGSKNAKLYPILISSIQKLFSHNFISHNQCLSQSLRLLKQQHKQFLLLPINDYNQKIFKEIYIETLCNLPERDDHINLMIVKNFSLIWRLSQSALSVVTIGKIFQFIIQSIIQNKIEENTQTLKSAFLEIVRHSFQSYKECLDYKLITDQNDISVKSICFGYGKVLFDQVTIRSFVQNKYQITDYEIIPDSQPQKLKAFKLLPLNQVNEKNQLSGKFGWCIYCRETANYYCKINRIPVCSFDCKNKSMNQFQMVDKLVNDEARSAQIFQHHIKRICRLFVKYLSGKDAKKTTCFSQIFVFVSTQLKKWNFSKISPNTLKQLRQVFRQTIFNIQVQHQAFIASILSMKKMLFLRTFIPQTQILLKLLSKKLVHFMTPTRTKQQILKVCREIITSNLILDYMYVYDCQFKQQDVVKQLVEAMASIYKGLTPPQGIIMPPEQPFIRRSIYEIMVLLFQHLKKCHHIMKPQQQQKLMNQKKKKNLLKKAIQRFNQSQKPTKIIKALIKQKYLPSNASIISQFLHKNLQRLSFSNIGQLIGGYDQLEIKIRDQYIGSIDFSNMMIDDGIRKLLKYFTIPGESQVVDRLIDCFSKMFYQQNKQGNHFYQYDAVYSLSYLLMMLQTNLHNPQVIQKMTLQQFANLSKGMNGPVEFQMQFLQKVYKSVQKTQLGFHQKLREMQIIKAYKQLPRNAQILHTKQLQRQIRCSYQQLEESSSICSNLLIPSQILYPMQILCSQLVSSIILVIIQKIHETQQKQQLLKELDLLENIMKFSIQYHSSNNIQFAIKLIWEEISKINTIKKYLLIQKFLDWIDFFHQYLQTQWNLVIYMFSKFYRHKLIKKEPPNNNKKDDKMVISGDKCYIYESFINSLWARSTKYTLVNFKCLIQALVQTNKQQFVQNAHPFCLQKIGQIQEYNMNRATDVFPILWPILKQYYIELGKNKLQQIALFGTDFLKQLITKFLKKKDLLLYQRQYMKPLEQIFISTKLFAVKQYIIGSLSYFINNHSGNIKSGGWKVIMPIICQAFQEDQNPIIKEKAFLNVRRIYQTKFSILSLEDNYVDFVQILSRLSHQKNQIYPKGCIDAVKVIVQYYHQKNQINLDNLQAESNQKLDIVFWQTYFLPLLSKIYGICGDSRTDVQTKAIELLFNILMKYGKLFKYEFWKMVLQGVLRPTFEEITYAAQSKLVKKDEHESWLRSSFELLFSSINQLIFEYFQDFRVFLYDVLKIYQTCILSYSNKILIQLSISSLGQLFNKVGNKFQMSQWQQFLRFTQSILKKTLPTQIFSQQNWEKQKELPQKSYQGKSIAINLFVVKIQQILQTYSKVIGENIIQDIVTQLGIVKVSIRDFNQDITLRKKLWEDGFFTNLKSLPGLLYQQYQIQKCIFVSQYQLSLINEQTHFPQYINSLTSLLTSHNKTMLTSQEKEQILQTKQQHRQILMQKILISYIMKQQLSLIKIESIQKIGLKEKLFECFLDICYKRSFCPQCQYCQGCQMNINTQKQFNQQIKNYIKRLFNSSKQSQPNS